MIFLLVYVGVYMPYGVCFNQSQPGEGMTTMDYVDTAVDILFTIDIFVNFISAYDDPATDMPVTKFKKISSNYIKTWFLFDVVAVIPFSLFENYSGGNSAKLTRLARLPRLYRLLRIIRMLKMLKFVGNQEEFN